MQILHHIDLPRSWSPLARDCFVRGWCFAANGTTIAQIRLRSHKLSFFGAVGLFRPDVKQAIAAAPNENTGFEIRGTLPSGANDIAIEAQLSDGTWHTLLTVRAGVQRQWMPLWLGKAGYGELIARQFPGVMKHPPRRLKTASFPKPITAKGDLPKISIVTPSFQQARYLAETLRSVLEQTQVDCEYVVQDGGSTDASVDLIRSFESSDATAGRLAAWESTRDNGQADAIARGFAKTSGRSADLMAWINSDDFYVPGALAFVADYFARHPEVDVVYGHRILVDENSREVGRWFLPRHDDAVLRLNDFVPQETLFWRRRIWDKVGGIDPSFKFAMDWDLLLRFQAAGARMVRLPCFPACFRIHAAQKTSAAMHNTGREEIDRLRERAQGKSFQPRDLENSPILLRYLRRSAWIESLARLGVQAG